MIGKAVRHLLYRRRLAAVHAWQAAERQQHDEHEAAKRRIIAQNKADRRAER